MERNRQTIILHKIFGSILIAIGMLFLFIKAAREYIPLLKPYSFELFMVSPLFIIIGLKLICINIKQKVVHTFSNVLLGLTVVYFIVLSASWYTINVM